MFAENAKMRENREEGDEPVPLLELTYQGDPAGHIDCASAFNPASDNATWLNRAILAFFGA